MRIAVRSSIASGVALVGAGAIALAPIQPVAAPLSNLHLPAVFSGDGVALTAATTFDPVTPWVDLITATVSNVATIGEDWLANPAPALRQLGTNWFGYTQTTVTALGGVASAAWTYLTTTVPESINTALKQIADGNLTGAAATINTALGTAVISVGLPLFPILEIPGKIADHLAAVVKTVTGLETVFPALIGVLGPLEGAILAVGDSAQTVLNSASAGNVIAALNAAINTLPTAIDAAINGYEAADGTKYPGVLSPPDENGFNQGLAYTLLVTIPKAIATALGAPVPPAGAALKRATPAAEAVSAEPQPAVEKATGTGQSKVSGTPVTDSPAAAAPAADTDAAESGSGPTTVVKDGNKVEPGQVGGAGATNAGGAKGATKTASAGAGKDSAGGAAGKGRSARHAGGSDN